ncbi:MAG: amino acid adenylation domain-containing protein, partial [Acidobacteria bacterium]|nr:amino acid adenylation domain-containing protein [Acidobacteriota bacterium]
MNKNEIITTGDKLTEARKYWLDHLTGKWEELFIPRDFPPTREYKPEHYSVELESRLTEKLNTAAKSDGLSLFVLLLTAFNILLHKFTGYGPNGRQDIAVLTPTLSRGRQHYNKWIILKNEPDARMTFKELLMAAKETVVNGYRNQHYPFDKLLKDLQVDDPSSLLNIVFVFTDIHPVEALSEIPTGLGKDLIIGFKSITGNSPVLTADVCFNALAFRKETIATLFSCYALILEQVMDNPNLEITNLELVTAEEKQQLMEVLNHTGYNYPAGKTIHELFAGEAAGHPHDPAVMDLTAPGTPVCLSYAELNERSEKIARLLKKKGIISNEIVAVWGERSWEFLVGILGILKAGGEYLALDPRYPRERIKFMLDDCSVHIMLTVKNHHHNIDNIEVINLSNEAIYEENMPFNDVQPGETIDPAYVIYTSGSTGTPKGVMVEHENVVRLVKNPNFINLEQGERLLLTGSAAFDIITFEIWGTLLNGLTLVLVDQDNVLNAEKLKAVILENRISILHLVPQVLGQLIDQNGSIFTGLKYLLVGGDVVNPGHLNTIRTLYPGLTVLHMYGPTETTTFATCYKIDRHFETAVPLGKPVNGTFVHIVGWGNKVQPVGAIGELIIGGPGVARGYINNPGLTNERFRPLITLMPQMSQVKNKNSVLRTNFHHSSFSIHHSKFYRTGDLARWLPAGPPAGGAPGGVIQFLGRMDRQVKIRGIRIEPAEIERRLLQHPHIKEAVVTTLEDGEKYLCAYYVSKPPTRESSSMAIPTTELKDWLKELPDYMIPTYFQLLNEFPLTVGGKIDRTKLPLPEKSASNIFVPPRNKREEEIADIWAEILKIDKNKIGIDSNFFELGGHSLRATGLIVRMHKKFNIKIPIAEIFKVPTIRNFSEYMDNIQRDLSAKLEVAEEREYYPLSPAQRQMFIFLQVHPGSTVYNGLEVLNLEGTLDGYHIEEVFKKLIRRHDSLRISFRLIGEMNEIPVMKIYTEVDFKVEWYNLEDANKQEISSQREPAAQAIIEGFSRPFDFSRAPLMRVGLIRLSSDHHLMLVDIHHIISDGYSRDIFVREFKLLYKEEKDKSGALPALAVQYKDYVTWQQRRQQSDVIKQQENFWLKIFSGEVPALKLP